MLRAELFNFLGPLDPFSVPEKPTVKCQGPETHMSVAIALSLLPNGDAILIVVSNEACISRSKCIAGIEGQEVIPRLAVGLFVFTPRSEVIILNFKYCRVMCETVEVA